MDVASVAEPEPKLLAGGSGFLLRVVRLKKDFKS
jgi:hypothetical protein